MLALARVYVIETCKIQTCKVFEHGDAAREAPRLSWTVIADKALRRRPAAAATVDRGGDRTHHKQAQAFPAKPSPRASASHCRRV
jgi:hypothetical protein